MDGRTDKRTDRQTDGRTDGRTDGQMDVRTNGQTNRRKFSPFYRTSSPIGAAALLPSMRTKEELNAKCKHKLSRARELLTI